MSDENFLNFLPLLSKAMKRMAGYLPANQKKWGEGMMAEKNNK